MKKQTVKSLLIFGLLLCFNNGTSQNYFAGIAIGPESVMAIPKFGVQFKKEKEKINFTTNAEASVWLFFTVFYSANISGGIEYKFLTLDHSVGVWKYPRDERFDFGPYSHFVYSPKLGVKRKAVYFKVGPGFIFSTNYSAPTEDWGLMNMTKITKLRLNFELLFRLD